MKRLIVVFLLIGLGAQTPVQAQFLKKLKDKMDKPLFSKKASKKEIEARKQIVLPAAGSFNEDKTLMAIAKKGLDAYYGELSMENTHQYLTSNKWSTVSHKVTGVPLYQWAVGAVIQKNSDGACMLYEFILRKDYTGGGSYGEAYFNGINRGTIKAPYGNYIDCEAQPPK